ncbi:hypothetical protein MYA98_04555 [Salmonella sp. WGH-01]|nr:hypothetical protein MYA98_04555 [Salmonella sp. WGH-01]
MPSALRNKPKTMMIRVKLVIISKIAGRNVSEVMKTSVWTDNDQLWPPPANGWLISPGSCAAAAGLKATDPPEKGITNGASGSPGTLE